MSNTKETNPLGWVTVETGDDLARYLVVPGGRLYQVQSWTPIGQYGSYLWSPPVFVPTCPGVES